MQAYGGTALATLKLHYARCHVADQMATHGFLDKFQEYWVERMIGDIQDSVNRNARHNAELTYVKIQLCRRAAIRSRWGTQFSPPMCGLLPSITGISSVIIADCRNKHPDKCRSAYEIFKQDADSRCQYYDLVTESPNLEGHMVMREMATTAADELLGLVSQLLGDNKRKIAAAGWCQATKPLLASLKEKEHLSVDCFPQGRLLNGDVMSSTIDRSQPASDNTWGLVAYYDRLSRSYYLCVIQVQYFVRLTVQSSVMRGFDPTVCSQYGLQVPLTSEGMCFPHTPLRLAVAKMWLAKPATSALGAVGCRESYDPESGTPPDLVLVKNMAEIEPHVSGTAKRIEAQSHSRRYYGMYCVHLDDICCQLGPTLALKTDGWQCFLACSKKSGKS